MNFKDFSDFLLLFNQNTETELFYYIYDSVKK
jgi:hypothetical protein